MSSLTRWVLAHKRAVVLFWIAMTVAGVAAAGPASRALELEFSIPDKEGALTNAEIAKRYDRHGRRRDAAAARGRAAEGQDGRLARRASATSRGSTRRSRRRCPAPASRPTPPPATARSSPATAQTVYALVYPTGADATGSARTPRRRSKASAALAGATVGGAPVHVTGFDALMEQSGEGGGARRSSPRRSSAGSAR